MFAIAIYIRSCPLQEPDSQTSSETGGPSKKKAKPSEEIVEKSPDAQDDDQHEVPMDEAPPTIEPPPSVEGERDQPGPSTAFETIPGSSGTRSSALTSLTLDRNESILSTVS